MGYPQYVWFVLLFFMHNCRQRTLQEGGIISSAISRLPEIISWNETILNSSDYESCEGDWDPIDPAMDDIESNDITAATVDEDPVIAISDVEVDIDTSEERECEAASGIASVMKGQKLLNGLEDICIPTTQVGIPQSTSQKSTL